MLQKTSLYSTCISIALFFLLQVGYCSRTSFVQTRGTRFFLNGRPLYLNGFNAYWLMLMASDPSTRMRVTTTFEQASKCKMNLARTWAFSDGVEYKPLQISPGSYNEEMFKGLDFVVSEARKHGIYLMLSLVNNWKDFGGKSQYAKWAKNQTKKLEDDEDDDFFTNSVARQYFKNHIKGVLTRVNTFTGIAYKDDPTIFAWELMNEPRCQSDLSGKNLQHWIAEMAFHVKSIDKNHLLEVGLEGFYGESRKEFNPGNQSFGTDFIWNNHIKQIDFATIHLYPDQWLPNSDEKARQEFVYGWFASHIEDSISVLKKPFLLAEFGQSSRLPGYNRTTRQSYFENIYETIYLCARRIGPCGGAIFWQSMAADMESYNDGYEVVLKDDPTIAGIITRQSRRLISIGS